jgi:CMP/dCMP kinase
MMAVITISREFGSGGDEVASRLCDVLGYRFFGKAQIIAAVEQTTLSKINAVDYTEDNHEVQTFIDRLMGHSATSVQRIAWEEDPSIASRPDRADVHERAVIGLVRRAVQAAVKADNIIIVGRGGQALLKGAPGVIHVRIEAPIDIRHLRVIEKMKQDGDTRSDEELFRAVGNLIANRDIASADYIQRYYHVDWADRELYHMVLNLGLLDIEQAVQMIAVAVHKMEKQPS